MADDEEETAEEVGADFHVVEKLGEGTYGKVYKAISHSTSEVFALKKIPIQLDDEGVPATAIREVSLLKECDHPNVIRLYEVLSKERALYLVFEYVDMDLRAYLKRNGPFRNPEALKNAAWQCIRGTEHCHSIRILHRDLKPQNVLVDVTGRRLKLADFGLARAFSVPLRAYTHEVVTLWYRAPEILLGQRKYATPTDIWSLGCIVAEMATNNVLFPGDSQIDTLFRIFRLVGTPSEEVWPGVSTLRDFTQEFPKWAHTEFVDVRQKGPALGQEGLDVINQCLRCNPVERASARQLLQHPFFEDLVAAEPAEARKPSWRRDMSQAETQDFPSVARPPAGVSIQYDDSWGTVLRTYLEDSNAADYIVVDRHSRNIPVLQPGNDFVPQPEDFPLKLYRKDAVNLSLFP
mmetsp:Transcript_44058/g.82382  ORF Transcript_44058/g.82382 Transcript_44058/m.82382 type:complete len:406 (+) Transcript_44058:3-1220(+)